MNTACEHYLKYSKLIIIIFLFWFNKVISKFRKNVIRRLKKMYCCFPISIATKFSAKHRNPQGNHLRLLCLILKFTLKFNWSNKECCYQWGCGGQRRAALHWSRSFRLHTPSPPPHTQQRFIPSSRRLPSRPAPLRALFLEPSAVFCWFPWHNSLLEWLLLWHQDCPHIQNTFVWVL